MSDTPEEITARAERLLANVTPGAWTWERNGEDYVDLYAENEGGIDNVLRPLSGEPYVGAETIVENPADAAFIAAAPQLVRDLVAEVKRLRAIGDESEGGDE